MYQNKKWTINCRPVKLEVSDKIRFESVVSQLIKESLCLNQIVNRTEIKAGRIYLYRLHVQFGWDKPDVQFIKPLIDGKYAEFPMARITLYDTEGNRCEADYQRHTGQWIHLYEGDIKVLHDVKTVF